MYLFFLDIDGTLLYNFDTMPQPNIEAIRKARALGHKVFINTGRGYAPKRLEVLCDGVVSCIGSRIVYHDNVLLDAHMDEKVAREVLEYVFENASHNCYRIDADGHSYLIGSGDLHRLGNEILTDDKDMLVPLLDRFQKVVISHYTDKDKDFFHSRFHVYVFDEYAETALPGYTKGSAIALLADHFGVDIAHTVAIGDSENDREMLQSAGISVAMGNASDSLKALCTMVTDDVKNAGVAKAMAVITKDFTV